MPKEKIKTASIQIFLKKEDKELIRKVSQERGLSMGSLILSTVLKDLKKKKGESNAG